MPAKKIKDFKPEELECVEKKCDACPFIEQKCPDEVLPETVEVLIISDKMPFRLADTIPGHTSHHAWFTECTPLGYFENKVDKPKIRNIVSKCCLGRKLDLINKLRPKLIISMGPEISGVLEKCFGNTHDSAHNGQILPTVYNGHRFWFMPIPAPEHQELGQLSIINNLPRIEKALATEPKFIIPNDDGIQLIMSTERLDDIFSSLAKSDVVAFDIETIGIDCYAYDQPLILTIALSNYESTYAFPLMHPQTPSNFDPSEIFARLIWLAEQTEMVGHNTIFDLNWLIKWIGREFIYKTTFHDSMAQSFLLNRPSVSKSLNNCTRRLFGFSLKEISGVDVANLKEAPLEQVLLYNARDAKYTHLLFKTQAELIKEQELERAYKMHVDRIPAMLLMRDIGVTPNPVFILEQSELIRAKLNDYLKEFVAQPEVKRQEAKYGICNPFSNPGLAKLFHEECGVGWDVTSFNDAFLKRFKHKIADLLINIRKLNKLHSTYLLPWNLGEEGGGDLISKDGKVHTNFKTTTVATGRLSSDQPNLQNMPSTRTGNKELRSIIKAPPGKILVPIDYGQIEFRIIAALTKDEKMIEAIFNDYDVHMYWAKKLVEAYPPFVKDPNDPKEMKFFRGIVKNKMVFPAIYKSMFYSIAYDLGLPKNKHHIIEPIFNEFWEYHYGITKWQEKTLKEYEEKGYVTSPLGRKFWGPLEINQIVNYPIQGTAGDLVINANARLAKLSINTGLHDLCPILNIHDDLTFQIEPDYLPDFLPIITNIMLDTKPYADWLCVPLTVEVSTGLTLGHVKEFGVYHSNALLPL